MNDLIPTLLQILLIIIALAIVFHKENFTIIIYISSFGLVAATLYVLNQAPDVAIAEVAIGSAIIPLIYVISISRQREFIVLDRVDHDLINDELIDEKNVELYQILNKFVDHNNLKMNVCANIKGSDEDLTTDLNVDLIVSFDHEKQKFILKGKQSSILMDHLIKETFTYDYIEIVTFKEGESID